MIKSAENALFFCFCLCWEKSTKHDSTAFDKISLFLQKNYMDSLYILALFFNNRNNHSKIVLILYINCMMQYKEKHIAG